MKKFCSKCGTQLDLGKRSCNQCHSFNPYFIAGFTNTSGSETANAHEIQKPLSDIEVIEETVEKKDAFAELIKLRREQLEQQKNDQALKNELLKVKEETEYYKKETFDLVKEVQKELHDIEKENKLLKEKVELLKTNQPVEKTGIYASVAPVSGKKQENRKGIAVIITALLMGVTVVSYFHFSNHAKNGTANTTANSQMAAMLMTAKDENKPKEIAKSSAPVSKIHPASSPNTSKAASVSSAPSSYATLPHSTVKIVAGTFSLTESKLKSDLVGKKISGCDIIINNSAEISSIQNLVLVDKLSASYFKYKCLVKIKQGSETFTSTPYIYYSAGGTFIKVDGTNCE